MVRPLADVVKRIDAARTLIRSSSVPLDQASANWIFQMVSRRYEKASIVLTGNRGLLVLVALNTVQLARRDFLFSNHDQVHSTPEDLCTIRAQHCALFLLTYSFRPICASDVGDSG